MSKTIDLQLTQGEVIALVLIGRAHLDEQPAKIVRQDGGIALALADQRVQIDPSILQALKTKRLTKLDGTSLALTRTGTNALEEIVDLDEEGELDAFLGTDAPSRSLMRRVVGKLSASVGRGKLGTNVYEPDEDLMSLTDEPTEEEVEAARALLTAEGYFDNLDVDPEELQRQRVRDACEWLYGG
jgi:hypothetical protein